MFTWEGTIKGLKDTMWEGQCNVFIMTCSKNETVLFLHTVFCPVFTFSVNMILIKEGGVGAY